MSRRVSRGPLGSVVLATAAWLALPLAPHADPAAAPAAGAPAQPLTVTRPDMPEANARREANRARIREARIEQLHAGLQLTPDQERLWPQVADAIHALDQARGWRFRQQLEAAATSIDGLKMQGDHMAKVGAAMGQLADATKPLVASLTPDQKNRLPALIERLPPRKLMARAFEVPVTDAGATAASPPAPAGGGAVGPGRPDGDAGTASPPKKEPDDDD